MKRKGCRIAAAVIGIALIAVAIWIGPVLASVYKAGFFDRIDREEYKATRTSNLKSIYTALTLHQDSEGAYPSTKDWMDSIEPRLRTDGMSKEEASRKLVRPDLVDSKGKFGYALNPAAANQYVGDLNDSTVLVFESEATERNASAEPKLEGGKLGITVKGEIIGADTGSSEVGK